MAIKKWFALFSLALFTLSFAHADELFTTVFNVMESTRSETILILSAADGRVYRTPKTEANLKFYKSLIGQVVKLSYQPGTTRLVNLQLANPADVDPKTMDLNHFQYNELRTFAPTNLQSLKAATDVFNGLLNDGDKRRSQCFKRAHMWVFDMWSKLGISSQKVFIFYSQRYIQLEEKADWWFHVAPMVIAGDKEYVLDGTFMDKPITVKEWQSFFIKSDTITCQPLTNYGDLPKLQWTRLCSLMKVPMYYFSPLDLEARDKNSELRNHWVLEELQDARRAFKNYDASYEGLDTGKSTITH